MIFTLFSLYIQLVFQEALESLAYMLLMFRRELGEDQHAVQIDENKPVDPVTENVVNQGLEHSRSVGQTKGHKYSKGPRGVLNAISFADTDKVVCIAQVQFDEDSCSMERGKRELIKRQWVLVFNSDVV